MTCPSRLSICDGTVFPRDQHSFPTRRSSDLGLLREAFEEGQVLERRGVEDDVGLNLGDEGVDERRVTEVSEDQVVDRKSTRVNSSHVAISYAVFCSKTKRTTRQRTSAQIPAS